MAENKPSEEMQAEWTRVNMGESYTQAFNIRQVMYRIQDLDLPFKRGIRVEQFLMFLGAFIVTLIFNSIIVLPLFRIAGLKIPPTFHLILWLAFPVFMAVRVGKPMPYEKTITGTAASFLRYNLDDRWHCRGLPMAALPHTGMQGNYLRTWTVDPAYAGVESPNDLPATEFAMYSNLVFPDEPVRLPEEIVQKKGILEDDESFMDRLTGSSNVGNTIDIAEAYGIPENVALPKSDREQLIELSESAPVFDRSSLRKTPTNK